jgi:hypothetical protein
MVHYSAQGIHGFYCYILFHLGKLGINYAWGIDWLCMDKLTLMLLS